MIIKFSVIPEKIGASLGPWKLEHHFPKHFILKVEGIFAFENKRSFTF
jgi:hypothetical protein